jgi:hypothetical protein
MMASGEKSHKKVTFSHLVKNKMIRTWLPRVRVTNQQKMTSLFVTQNFLGTILAYLIFGRILRLWIWIGASYNENLKRLFYTNK